MAISKNTIRNLFAGLFFAAFATVFGSVQALADVPSTGVITFNIANSGGDGDDVGKITADTATLIGDISSAAWQNSVGGASAPKRDGTITEIAAWDGAASTTLSGVTVTWQVGEDLTSANTVGNYCRNESASPVFQRCWLARGDGSTHDEQPATITISNIPYDSYDVIVYLSGGASLTAGSAFQPVKVNNVSYIGDASDSGAYKTVAGAAIWGTRQDSLEYGVNAIRVSGIATSSVTIQMDAPGSGTTSGTDNERKVLSQGIAAVQIVEYVPTIGENDLLVKLSGDETYTFDAAKTFGTVYVTGSGTLTFAGTASTATTLDIGPNATVTMTGSSLAPTTVTGSGTAVYDGALPTTTLGYSASLSWTGVVWLKNNTGLKNFNPGDYGNKNSTVRLTGIAGYFPKTATIAHPIVCEATVELVDDGSMVALSVTDGYSYDENGMYNYMQFHKLAGTGTLSGSGNAPKVLINVLDGSEFTGSLMLANKGVCFGSGVPAASGDSKVSSTIVVNEGATVTVASGKTWTADSGFTVNGTLNVNGSLSSSASTSAVSGSGTVVFAGALPSPTGDTWWKNSAWTGTVEMRDYQNLSGTSTDAGYVSADMFNSYGNENSILRFSGVKGYTPKGCTISIPVELKNSENYSYGLNHNNGWEHSGTDHLTITKLKGTGKLLCDSAGNQQVILINDWSEFTGNISLSNHAVYLGGTPPTSKDGISTAGLYINGDATLAQNQQWIANSSITIAEGCTVDLTAKSGYLSAGTITVDGTLVAKNYGQNFGGPYPTTAMTVSDTGVLKFAGGSNAVDLQTRDMSKLGGTGTVVFEGTNWIGLPKEGVSDCAMFSETLAVDNRLAQTGLVFSETMSIGTLSGNGQMRSDLGSNNGATKILTIVQSKDSEWSGLLHNNNDRTKQLSVKAAKGATAKTLTLSATQSTTKPKPLVVEAADDSYDAGSVNLTGMWNSNVTVSGTFGGTGTVTGDLTFNAGSTFKAFATDSDGLTVSGTVVLPSEGSVTVDVSGIDLDAAGTTLVSSSSITASTDIGKLSVSRGFLKAEDGSIKVYPVAALVTSDGTAHVYDTLQAAVDDFSGYYVSYDYFVLYQGENVPVLLPAGNTAWQVKSFKLKCAEGASAVVSVGGAGEYQVVAGEADSNGIVTYTYGNKACSYTWAGSSTLAGWAVRNNWTCGAEAATASRVPGSGDTVAFASAANVSLPGDVQCAGMTVNGEVEITAASVCALAVTETLTFGAGGSLAIASESVSISAPAQIAAENISTSVEGYHVVETQSEDKYVYSIAEDEIPEEAVAWWDNDFSETDELESATAFKNESNPYFGGVFTKGTGDESAIESGALSINTEIDNYSQFLKWTPVAPAENLVTNIVEMAITMSDVEELPANAAMPADAQFALVSKDGKIHLWNGSWVETQANAPSGESAVLKLVFDYSTTESPKADVYIDGSAVSTGFALNSAASSAERVNNILFGGSGTIDNFKGFLKGYAQIIVVPGVDAGEFETLEKAQARAGSARVAVPDSVRAYVSNEAGYTGLFVVVPVEQSGGTYKLSAVLGDAGKDLVKTSIATVAAAVEARISEIASSGEAQSIAVDGLIPGFYYAVATSGSPVGEYAVDVTAEGAGWQIADGSGDKNGEMTLLVPAPDQGDASKFYVIKVKTVAE